MVKALNNAFPQIEGDLMSTIAEKYIEQGVERGLLRATRESVLDVLHTRFDKVPTLIADTIDAIQSVPTLKALLRKAILASSLEDFVQELP